MRYIKLEKYFYDMHVHTFETSSCAIIKALELVRLYKDVGYQGIVVTDHFFADYFENLTVQSWEEKIDKFLEGYKNAFKEGQEIGLDVFLGIELQFNEGKNDYLVYGIDEDFLKANNELYRLGLIRFKELVKAQDILIYQAHPFRSWVTPAKPSLIDGIEVFNGRLEFDSSNDKALVYAKNNDLKMISGSDFHQIEDLASGGIILPKQIKSNKDLVKVLKSMDNINMVNSNIL